MTPTATCSLDRPTLPVEHPAPVPAAALALLQQARRDLHAGELAEAPATRYATAHLAALRAAAAVLAARARPDLVAGRRRPRNAWALLVRVAPELGEWAAFFAAGAGKRAAAEAGLPAAVTAREADDLLRDAETFVGLVAHALGVPAAISHPGPGP